MPNHSATEVVPGTGRVASESGDSVEPARGLGRLLTGAISSYQRFSAGTQPRCRYLPTCSEYADDAIRTHGSAKGSWLALRRLCRCHPFGSHGFDPVPPAPTPTPESS